MPIIGAPLDALTSARFRGAVLLDVLAGEQASPDSGQLRLFARDDVLWTKTSAGVERELASADRRVVDPTFSITGEVNTVTGTGRYYNSTGRTLTIVSVRASVNTAPTGATLVVDVHKSGSTIFTTQGNRPAIAISGNTAVSTSIDVPEWADGEYLTVDVDQVGSTVKGSNLTVQVVAI